MSVPAKCGQGGLIDRLGGRRHFRNGRGSKHASPTIQQRLRKKRQVVGGGKYSGVPCHTTHPAGRWIMHHSAHHVVLLVLFWWSNPRLPRPRRKESALFRAQRSNNVLRGIFIERLTHKPC